MATRALLAYVRLLRPGNAVISAVAALIGAYLAAGHEMPWQPVLLAAVAAFSFAGAGNVRNDLGDVALDRTAHPDRPLVTGAARVPAARALAVALYAVALACGALISLPALLLVAAAMPVMEGYERWGKARGLPGNLAIGLLTAAPFVLGALAATGRAGPAVLALAGLAALATVGREILKDVEDEAADRAARRTLPMRIGARRAALVAAAFLVAAVSLSPLPWLLETVLGWSYFAAVSVADACFVTAAAVGARRPARGQRLAKLGMIIALVALALGRAQADGGSF